MYKGTVWSTAYWLFWLWEVIGDWSDTSLASLPVAQQYRALCAWNRRLHESARLQSSSRHRTGFILWEKLLPIVWNCQSKSLLWKVLPYIPISKAWRKFLYSSWTKLFYEGECVWDGANPSIDLVYGQKLPMSQHTLKNFHRSPTKSLTYSVSRSNVEMAVPMRGRP